MWEFLGGIVFEMQVHKVKSKRSGEYVAAKFINKMDKKEMCTKKMAVSERDILHLLSDQEGVSNCR